MKKTKEVQGVKLAPGEKLVVKPDRPMTKEEFDLLGQQVAAANAKGDVEIVLIPFSAKVAGTEKKAPAKRTPKKATTASK